MDLVNNARIPARSRRSFHRLCGATLALLWIVSFDIPAAELRVQVAEQGAGPLSAAAVCLGTSANPTQFGAKRSTTGGSVVFKDLPAAPLLLTVSKQGYLGRKLPLSTMYSNHTLSVQIPTGGGGPVCQVVAEEGKGVLPNTLTITTFRLEKIAGDNKAREVRLVHTLNGKATHYRVSETPGFSHNVWQPYKRTPQIKLSNGKGEKTVYLQVRRYNERHGAWLETLSNVAKAKLPAANR